VLVIRLSLSWYLDAHVSFRGIGVILFTLVLLLGCCLPLSLPYPQTVRSWLLRCGLFLLHRLVPARSDWVWIVDLTICIGQLKCLLVLGVSLERLRDCGAALEHHSVVVLDLWVTAHCTGVDVDDRLEALAGGVGTPVQVVRDHGSDLYKGMALFAAAHPEVIDTYDVTHKLASLLKAELEVDQRWAEFLQRCTSSLFELQQSRGAFLTPPSQRSLDRYMNVDRHTDWAWRTLAVLDAQDKSEVAGLLELSEEEARSWLAEKLGWLQDFRQEVARYKHLLDAVRQTEQVVKNQGLSQQTVKQVWDQFAPEVLQDASLKDFLTELRLYLEQEGGKVPPGQPWLGSSDVIESLFGKYKSFAEKAPYAEVGASALAIPLFTVELTAELIHEALTSVSMDDVRAWTTENGGQSILSKVAAITVATEADPASLQDTDSG